MLQHRAMMEVVHATEGDFFLSIFRFHELHDTDSIEFSLVKFTWKFY